MSLSPLQKGLATICAGMSIVLVIALIAVLFPGPVSSTAGVRYVRGQDVTPGSTTGIAAAVMAGVATSTTASTTPVFAPQFVSTPEAVKAIYMTSWVSGVPKLRNKLVALLDTTEANAVVIDIKDYSGRITFAATDPEIVSTGAVQVRSDDLPQFIDSLHKKGIYVIARIAVFQDAYYVTQHPELAVKNKAGTATWKDRKGISWIDAGAQPYWNYIVHVGRAAHAIGFDELNFDYIRYPSDGDLKDVSYPQSALFGPSTTKAIVLKNFFSFLHDQLKTDSGVPGVPVNISADLFGLTTSATDDLGIGQVLTNALPYFDYVAPMVYPSHFGAGYDGFKNPAEHPYDVIHAAMSAAVSRADKASTSPLKLRPWLQDFDLGASYDAPEVRAQIQATYDVGLTSWMLWSASNVYTEGGLKNVQ